MGLMKFSAEGIKQIKQIFNTAVKTGGLLGKPVENSYMTDLLQAVIDTDSLVTAVPVHGEWVEIDTVKDLHSYISKKRIDKISTELVN
jgi:L-glutamine-phosphate cytidylyltransferase